MIIRLYVFVAALLFVLAAGNALALDPNRSFDQLGQTIWTLENGAPTGITALAQTPDGYLWIGTDHGLYRFDGIRFERPPAMQGNRTRSDAITAFRVDKDGDLWIGRGLGGVSIIHDGRLADANSVSGSAQVVRIVQTKDGAIWVALMSYGVPAQLRRFLNGRWEIINGGERGLPNLDLVDAFAARDGSLWVALVNRVVRLKPGARTFETVSDKIDQAENLAQDADGRIWIYDAAGPRPLVGTPAQEDRGPDNEQTAGFTGDFIADRQGELWMASDNHGIFRIRDPAAFARGAPASGPERFEPNAAGALGPPDALLQDREGNIWVGANGGLMRFRDVSITSYLRNVSAADLNKDIELTPSPDGDFYTLWGNSALSSDEGKARLFFNHLGTFSDISDRVVNVQNACTARDNTFWFADDSGLHSIKADRKSKFLPWPDSIKGKFMMFCQQDKFGRLWVLIQRGGLFRFDGQLWTHFALPDDNGAVPWLMAADAPGRILVYETPGSVFRIDGDRVEKLIDRSKIDIPEVRLLYAAGGRVFLGGDGGLMVDNGAGFKTFSAANFPFLSHVGGMVQTKSGDLWLLSVVGLVRLTKTDFDRALEQEGAGFAPRIFDFRDGLKGEANRTESGEVIESGDGRVWFGTTEELGWIDPNNLLHNDVPPPVLIRSVDAKGRSYDSAHDLLLPAGTTQLQIDYTATSLSVPERVRFRYRLTGVDNDWVDAGTRRQAFYTNLGPGNYRFTVIAANDDGVWNMTGASTEFRVPPTFVQSKFFLALCAVVAAVALWLLYRLRLHQVAARLRLRHEERLAERERIARELHDTLLQGVQSLIFRFQSVADCIPKGQSARELLEKALDRADQVIAEGRDRVAQLRQTGVRGSLMNVLQESSERILAGAQIEVRLTLEGTSRELTKMVEEELVSIADEFLFNTLQHAGATELDITLNYDRKALTMELSDNGRGIDPDTLNRGKREGHFGLPGMRERARKIGAEFTLSSRPGAGVMVAMKVPASVAYVQARRWFVPLPLKLLNAVTD